MMGCSSPYWLYNISATSKISTGPGYIIAVIIPESRATSGIALQLFAIVQYHPAICIQACIIKKKTFTICTSCPVAKPGLPFIALRTINRHAFIIRSNTPPGIFINLIDGCIRSFETNLCLQVIINKLSFKIIHSWCTGITSDLNITKSMINKRRLPGFLLLLLLMYIYL